MAEVFVGVRDPRQAKKVQHSLVELLVVAISAVVSGADTFAEIEVWGKLKLAWLRRHIPLENGIPSHDTFSRVFAAIDAEQFGQAFQRWVAAALPVLAKGEVVAIDGKTSRRSGKIGGTPLHMVSAFAAGAALVLGQRATAEKSNEKTAIPELLATLMLDGCIVTIDAMGTQPTIAEAIRARGADYILSVKDNQPKLAESMRDFMTAFFAAPETTPHHFDRSVDKNHHRIETRSCYVFDQLDCLHAPERWRDLKSFAVIVSERIVKGKTTTEQRYYIASLPKDAARLNSAVRQHWCVENTLHWCMDVVFADDQMRSRINHAAHNLSVVRHLALNAIRHTPPACKGGLKARRLAAASSDDYRATILGLV